jgi:threonine/homoserine/homoserine lactone efflux protein
LSVTNFQFFLAALIIAAVPGPGILYVAARTLSGGRAVGLASTAGTALGGLVHVIAGGLGVSAIILASAQAFAALKFAGALYLVWLGIRTFRDAGRLPAESTGSAGAKRAFLEGIAVEALNPKTAAFFLAFIPQFLDPAVRDPGLTSATRRRFVGMPLVSRRLGQGSGLFIAGLGISLALVRRPAAN